MTTRRQALGLGGWLALTFVAAWVGSIASRGAPEFYSQLDRPAWAPPASVFGPVWTVLYLLMAIAAWHVWRRGERVRPALTLYVAQLVANSLWSWLFFGWRMGAFAFAEVVVLWVLILATMLAFWRVSRVAALLLVPYLCWVTYASALTFSVWRRNPALL